MHQPQRGQPAVVPAPPAAGTFDAAAVDASTVATVPPPNPLPPPPPLLSPQVLGRGPGERGAERGRAAKPAHAPSPPRPPPPNCACCLCIRGAVCVVLRACLRACPFSNPSHSLQSHALPFYPRQPPSCCPVLQYLSWRPSGCRVERCKHLSGPRQPMQGLRPQARP